MEVRHRYDLSPVFLTKVPQVVSKSGQRQCTVILVGSSLVSVETNEIRSYDGSVIVNRSIALGQPVVYVSMNYR